MLKPISEHPVQCSLADLAALAVPHEGEVRARFRALTLHSHFQPVFSASHRRAVGFEALVRGRRPDGSPVLPRDIFGDVTDEGELVMLDRLCRYIHTGTFAGSGIENTWLFLNVNPTVASAGASYGAFFRGLLEHFKLAPYRIVIEILENAIADEVLLSETVRYYQELGCLVAIDDFGAGSSNFERIWRIGPQIVKLDRSMIQHASTEKSVRRVLPSLVSLLHETGSLTLMEGIETEDQAKMAIDSGIDFVQGYFFARPAPLSAHLAPLALPALAESPRAIAAELQRSETDAIRPYVSAFREAAHLMTLSSELETAVQNLLMLPRTRQCFLLDAQGVQAGPGVAGKVDGASPDPRFRPLHAGSGSVWARRPYFRRALAEPGKVQVSRPYLSVIDARMCVTLSITVDRDGHTMVLCADLAWDD